MRRSPLGRLVGSVLSWLLFSFCLTLLFQSALVVMGLGGFCASGGPYEIRTECPATVAWATPVSILGGCLAVGIALLLAGGFGLPLVDWAWPALFCGLAVAFGIAGAAGSIAFVAIAVVFAIMGLVPAVIGLRAAWQRTVLGTANLAGARLAEHPEARASLTSRAAVNPDGSVTARPIDWAAGLIPAAVAIAAGIWLGALVFAAG